MTDDLEAVQRALAGRVTPDVPDHLNRRLGVVDDVNTDGTLDVEIGGVVVPGVKRLAHYVPKTGDSVFVEFSGTDPIVVGRAAEVPYWPNIMEQSSVADSSTTSTSYVDWPTSSPLTFDWRKLLTSTQVLVHVQLSGYVSTAVVFEDAVRIDGGGDTGVRRGVFNPANTHLEFNGWSRLSGLSAGLHTFTMRVRLVGTATITADSGDRQTITVQEIPVPLTT